MKDFKKKLVVFLLAVVMILGILPMSAFAAVTHEVVPTKYATQFYDEDNEFYIQFENDDYVFNFDIVCPSGSTDIVDGQTYTLTDMLECYSWGGDYETSQYIDYETVSFVRTGNGSVYNITVVDANGTTYQIDYTLPIGSFTDLQAKVDSAESNSTIKLMTDYTYGSVASDNPTAILIDKTITLDLNGHTISGNNDNSNCIIYIQEGGTLTLNDSSTDKTGKITGGQGFNYNNLFTQGGAVYNKGTFVMNGGEISGNTAQYGGGVSNIGTFIMNDGSILGNTATARGGGVYNESNFAIYDGVISGNTATDYGGGVASSGTFTVGGTANITNNTADIYGNNVILGNGTFFTIAADMPLTAGASIGVSTEITPTEDSSVTISDINTTDYSNYFFSDYSGYNVAFNTDHLELAISKTDDDPSDTPTTTDDDTTDDNTTGNSTTNNSTKSNTSSNSTKSPKTGNSSNTILWLSLLLGFVASIIIIEVRRRRA